MQSNIHLDARRRRLVTSLLGLEVIGRNLSAGKPDRFIHPPAIFSVHNEETMRSSFPEFSHASAGVIMQSRNYRPSLSEMDGDYGVERD